MRNGLWRISTLAAGVLLVAGLLPGEGTSGTSNRAAEAYAARQEKELERASTLFARAVKDDPANLSLRKDYAYTLLSIGRTEDAREEFRRVVSQDPDDSHSALEYAFLCHDTGMWEEAWHLFKTLRKARNPEHRATAERAFAGMERELTATIERLEAILHRDPENYSIHLELARTLRTRNEFARSAARFESAYRLKPAFPEILLELASVLHKAGDDSRSNAAILTASRSDSAFVAEQAKALLPSRYPYLSEFQAALEFQPDQPALRREMAYFLLSLGREPEATIAFQELLSRDPKDFTSLAQLGFLKLRAGARDEAISLLTGALRTSDVALKERVRAALREVGISDQEKNQTAAPIPQVEISSRVGAARKAHAMGEKSYGAGFIPDAIRYFEEAHRLDPVNFGTILRLAWSLNMAKRDDEALRWFALAAKCPDPAIADEAREAIRNLTTPSASPVAMAEPGPRHSGVVSSFWAMPMYSSRWESAFAYSQVKLEYETKRLPLVPYLSVRFVGDTTGTIGAANPQFLSENAFIIGVGARTRSQNGVLVWAEAGSTVAYLSSQRQESGSFLPDYRGGLSQMKLWGPSLQNARAGWFAETMNDVVYIHRFDQDTLAISRNRIGRHFGKAKDLGAFQFQAFWNLNLNTDLKRQAWANFAEAGPGIRFRWAWMPPPVSFSFSYVCGFHTVRRIDDRPNTYSDFQAGLWYAVSH